MPIILGAAAICIAVVLVVFDLTDNTKEPLDSYYIHFSSSENYINNLYKNIDSLSTIIYPIEDTLLDIIKKECFNYSNQQFNNKKSRGRIILRILLCKTSCRLCSCNPGSYPTL